MHTFQIWHFNVKLERNILEELEFKERVHSVKVTVPDSKIASYNSTVWLNGFTEIYFIIAPLSLRCCALVKKNSSYRPEVWGFPCMFTLCSTARVYHTESKKNQFPSFHFELSNLNNPLESPCCVSTSFLLLCMPPFIPFLLFCSQPCQP